MGELGHMNELPQLPWLSCSGVGGGHMPPLLLTPDCLQQMRELTLPLTMQKLRKVHALPRLNSTAELVE